MRWIKQRLAEPSTHAGIAMLAMVGMQLVPPGPWHDLALSVAGVFGVTAVAKQD